MEVIYMMNLLNPYLKRICPPSEFGYYGSLMLIYEFPNGITMYLIDTCRKHVPYYFVYQLYDAEGRKLILRAKEVIFQTEPFYCTEGCAEMFFERILKLGIDEEIEPFDSETEADEYLIQNASKLFY